MPESPAPLPPPGVLPPARVQGSPSGVAAALGSAFRGKAAVPGLKPAANAMQEAENRSNGAPQRPTQARSAPEASSDGHTLPPVVCEAVNVAALPGVRKPHQAAIPAAPASGKMSLAQFAESRGIKLQVPGSVVFEAPEDEVPAPAGGTTGREVMEEAMSGDGWSPSEIARRTTPAATRALDGAPKPTLGGAAMAVGALANLSKRQ